jgi:hypothetical protein
MPGQRQTCAPLGDKSYLVVLSTGRKEVGDTLPCPAQASTSISTIGLGSHSQT